MNCPACNCQVELDAAYCGVCGSRLRARKDTLTGSVLADEYRIESKIAEGGFGSIYQATHIESGLDVALKVMHAELAADPSLAARFRREGATLSRLHDTHTVATYDVGEDEDGTLFIAMELLHGENLHDRMTAQGLIHWRDSLAIIRDVCSALAEAHELGIVHRDLKPANVYLTSGDMVKLLDFGIAKVSGSEVDDGADLTRMGQTIGTLEYMAPEQIIGGTCEPRSDIYQLGVLMFEMITGRRPFADAVEPTAMITALLTQTAPAVSSMFCHSCLPAELDALIQRCLEREPEHRFRNVRELVDAIGAILSQRDATAAQWSTPGPHGDERTYLDGSQMPMQTLIPRVTALGPSARLAPATMPTFDVGVRGSVAEGMPLDGTGEVQAISEYVVEALGSEPRHASVAPPVVAPIRPAPPSVSMAVPLPRRTTSIEEFLARSVDLNQPPTVVVDEPPAATGLPFAARVALWTAGLAVSGAVIGAVIAIVAG
jgi:serine/threonine-protein kinase